ncbi:MAG: hypothetical protein H8E20_02710 [Verrucomicrobia bacterium]|nr:hypothetical protein [Verrucomicrobiota bacterium]
MKFSANSMLDEIGRIISFGIRRPGYDEGLGTEQFLLERFSEIGLDDTRLGSVLPTALANVTTRLRNDSPLWFLPPEFFLGD